MDTAEDRNFLPPQLYAGQPPYMVPHFMRLTDKQKVQKDINYVVARTHSSRCWDDHQKKIIKVNYSFCCGYEKSSMSLWSIGGQWT